MDKNRISTENMWKLTIKYSLPTVIGMLVNALYNVVDRFWVGQMGDAGDTALTGIGLCMPIMTVILGAAQLVGIGASSNISISLGKGEKDRAEHVLGNTLFLTMVSAILISVFGLIFKNPILVAVGATDATMPFSLEYITIILSGCVFQLLSFNLNHPIRAAGNPIRFASTQMLGAVVNMILDPIFIFLFDMGIKGAALATIIAQLVSACWVISYYYSKNSTLKFHVKYLKPSSDIIKHIVAIGVSPFLMQIASSLIIIIANRSLLHYGRLELGVENENIAIGAMTVIGSISTLIFMPLFGISQGTQPIIGYNYGAGDYKRVKEAFKCAVSYSLIICVLGFISTQLFSHQLISTFNKNPLLVEVGAKGLRIFLGAIVLLSFQIPAVNFFLSLGKARSSIILSLLRQILLLIPLYLILPLFFGLTGIWMAGLFADIISSIVVAFVMYFQFKKLSVQE